MNKSESLGSLAKALAELQGEIEDPIKNRKSHTGSYSDLTQILKVARPLLKKYGLAVSQLPGKSQVGKVSLETILMHGESGEWISCEHEMDSIPATERTKSTNSAQATGVIITYARRYALTALLGISAQEDTDGGELNPGRKITSQEISSLLKACSNNKEKVEGVIKWAGVNNISELTLDKYLEILEIIKKQNGVN